MRAVSYVPHCQLAVIIYALFPFAVTLGFSPRANGISSLKWDRGVAVAVTPTILFSDVTEPPAETGESIEQEDAQPQRVVRRERHTLFVANLPRGKLDICYYFEEIAVPTFLTHGPFNAWTRQPAKDISDEDLRGMFSESGTVELVSIPVDRETGEGRGFAFVDMSSAEEVETAIENVAESSFAGRTIRVSKSLPKEQVKKQAFKERKFVRVGLQLVCSPVF